VNRFIKIIKNPYKIVSYLGMKGLLKSLSDETYLKLLYRGFSGKNLNINSPQTFNEKIQWLKLYDRNPLYTGLVDKYEVRSYIRDKIGDEYLIPLLGVYNNFEDINFDELPNKFVLKCTHDSGGIVICKDKNKLDINKARKKINNSLSENFYYYGREWPYKNIKPRIICEKYMVDESDIELKDYKFMSFNGEIKCSFVCLNRNSDTGLNVDFYDMDWNLMPFERHYPSSGGKINKPINFDKMIGFAKILSKDIPFLRVDFYEINGKVYFGELTFYPGSGFEGFNPEKYDELLGSWLELPIEKQIGLKKENDK
jgi:hypothetical protein